MFVDPAGESPQIAAALVVVITMLVGVLVFLIRTYTEAKAVNRAVNNIGPGDHSLWDQVSFIREDIATLVEAQKDFAERGWRSLPDDLNTAPLLTQKVRELEHADRSNGEDHARIVETLDRLTATLAEHDRWERSQKYGD